MSILIILNNYFHDVATAVPLASAVILYVLERRAESGGVDERRSLARAYRMLAPFALGAAAWIVVGGIPRAIFFMSYEWGPAMLRGIVPALIVKLVLMGAAMAIGAVMWGRLSKVRVAADASEK